MFADSAISWASWFLIPYCSQRTFAPILTACFAIIGDSFDGRKTLTTSIEMVISSNLATAVSPYIFIPAEEGLTGITL